MSVGSEASGDEDFHPVHRTLLSDTAAMERLVVIPVPCLSDNYAYLVHEPGEEDAIVVDASESAPVLNALREHGLVPRAILSTHHHIDHVGGNLEMAGAFPGIEIYGSAHDKDRIPGLTRTLAHNGGFSVRGLEGRALMVPGHTLGATAFVIDDAVFTGDTLFVAGCGRLFEGDAATMARSLLDELASLPDDTLVYCGHEYTVSNARFAKTIDKGNAAVDELLRRAEKARAAGLPTVPSTIAQERAHNPFLRVADEAWRQSLGTTDRTEAFALVRKAKDVF